MKILSYNIWFSNDLIDERYNALLDLIKEENPDVICLQETTMYIFNKLITDLDTYKYFYPLVLTQAYDCIIISRFNIEWSITMPYTYTTMGRKLICIEIKDEKKKSYIIANSHFESEFKAPVDGILQNKNKLYQYQFACEFLNSIGDKMPVIMCADSNVQSYEEEKYFCEWNDAYIINGKDREQEYTYDYTSNEYLYERKIHYRGRVDRIMYNNNVKLKSYKLIKKTEKRIEISDHHGILVEFE
jgi:endonuclease/exonuclease/phosphatase family metal-dependent hydrolase